MGIEVKQLTPERAQDFLDFFDDVAFTDNPDWAECYCCFYYFGDEEFSRRTGAMNREYAQQAIESGRMNGLLAYKNGETVGWINANEKGAFARLGQGDEPGGAKVLSVVCFTIAPGFRRQGIATRLLQAAIKRVKAEGFDFIEAYPVKDAECDAHHYHGPIELYRKNGFEVAQEMADGWVVRKNLSR